MHRTYVATKQVYTGKSLILSMDANFLLLILQIPVTQVLVNALLTRQSRELTSRDFYRPHWRVSLNPPRPTGKLFGVCSAAQTLTACSFELREKFNRMLCVRLHIAQMNSAMVLWYAGMLCANKL